MKVFAIIAFVIGTTSALGSGPYLPSGWRPQGPAFYLPSESVKPSDNPLKDVIIQESEASGSDSLREYGPPKVQEVSQDITEQGLPEAITEQPFVVIEAKITQEELRNTDIVTESDVELSTEVVSEQKTVSNDEVAVTESQVAVEEETTAITQSEPVVQIKTVDIEVLSSVEETTQEQATEIETTEKNAEVTQTETENANSNIVSSVQERERTEEVVIKAQNVEQGVKNIADALENLENEIKAQQVQNTEVTVTEVKTVTDNSGSLEQAPEGFLEYGPPGFREYGPPKDGVLKSADIVEEQSSVNAVETNEARKRRFSPKFRSTRKAH